MLEDLLEKPETIHKHMGNVSREMEMIKRDHMEVLETKNMLLQVKNLFDGIRSILDTKEEKDL